jgi:hypothetical protein
MTRGPTDREINPYSHELFMFHIKTFWFLVTLFYTQSNHRYSFLNKEMDFTATIFDV